MGKEKAGALTPKAIANRIKAKGLQKLRWFCQMCQKQCRDENGFKCHTMSESHQRQLLLFADNPEKFVDTFSKEFCDDFLKLLKRRNGTKRVHANQVYQEYISDRLHVHMNSTQWETLSEFVKWLGKEGLCKVDQTEKGWFVAYIDRDPDTIERQEALKAKEKMELDDAEKQAKLLQKQIDRELARKGKEVIVYTELQKSSEEEKVAFNLGEAFKKPDAPGPSGLPVSENPLQALAKEKSKNEEKNKDRDSRKRKSALEEIIEVPIKKEKISKKDYWLIKGIIVKVIYKKLGEKYYKKKGVVKDVENRYVGIIRMLDSGDTLKVDQEHLETVIPAIGKSVMVLNGAHRGATAKLLSLNEKTFSVSIQLKEGPQRGRNIDGVPYEDISKLDA
ncbi:predicted protein [Nematostella vectensis]|uniref:DNA/RNA-binding protein Kin17 WH-like domain-containing protein n=1 Tax=Nematostella vectensis TaxID=45351 RepID=A7SDF8_NEMVE|nr:predicted protein [Nematostella vectensis]|eukprot:XP_001630279.1 predicted protein [Nematostella vectensis]